VLGFGAPVQWSRGAHPQAWLFDSFIRQRASRAACLPLCTTCRYSVRCGVWSNLGVQIGQSGPGAVICTAFFPTCSSILIFVPHGSPRLLQSTSIISVHLSTASRLVVVRPDPHASSSQKMSSSLDLQNLSISTTLLTLKDLKPDYARSEMENVVLGLRDRPKQEGTLHELYLTLHEHHPVRDRYIGLFSYDVVLTSASSVAGFIGEIPDVSRRRWVCQAMQPRLHGLRYDGATQKFRQSRSWPCSRLS